MAEAGLTVREDGAGTVIGRRSVKVDGPVVMIGSHFDSVRCGGAFDGTAGVVVAIEIARVLEEHEVPTVYPIEIIAMVEEEGGRFGAGLFGSRAMAGLLSDRQLEFRDVKYVHGRLWTFLIPQLGLPVVRKNSRP